MNTIRRTCRCARAAGWPLERALFALAGTVIVGSVALAHLTSPWFSALTLVVGLSQWLYAAVAMCPASLVLARALRLQSALCGQATAPCRRRCHAAHRRKPTGPGVARDSLEEPGPLRSRRA